MTVEGDADVGGRGTETSVGLEPGSGYCNFIVLLGSVGFRPGSPRSLEGRTGSDRIAVYVSSMVWAIIDPCLS